MFKTLAGALAGLCLALPLPAQARDVPPGAVQPTPANQAIHGRVTRFNGAYALSVRDENGALDSVTLHPGTIINPAGLTLAPGMIVSISGHPAGSSFAANEIDTPYQLIDGFAYDAGALWDGSGAGANLDLLLDGGLGRAPHGGSERDGHRGGHGGDPDHGGGGGGGDHGGGGGQAR